MTTSGTPATLPDTPRVLLIGGTSHSGKSTLAQALAARLDWHTISTDKLARHPGRPWNTPTWTVPEHVKDYYLTYPVDELIVDVLRHYRGMWPGICELITAHTADPAAGGLVLEGSALWPETVATLDMDRVAALWLTASNALFEQRIYCESGFAQATERGQVMIQKFLDRTLVYNAQMMDVVHRLDLPYIDIETTTSLDELVARCLEKF